MAVVAMAVAARAEVVMVAEGPVEVTAGAST
jgi:hypothetical protein